jgi:nucleotide-binding universal stress UspA family protein
MDEFVVGVDGSDHSRMALRWAAVAGERAGVAVRAAQSWAYEPSSTVFPIGPLPFAPEEIENATLRNVTAVIDDTLGSSSSVTAGVLRGPPVAALLQAVTPAGALVLGSRGLGGFRGLLLGSVSQECVEYAPCPVVIVRTDRGLGDDDVVLVGTDGSAGAQHALEWAGAFAKATGAQVHAVRASRGKASDTAEHGTEVEAIDGDPREVLLTAAARIDPSLVVVGRRGAGGLRSMRLGSTANHLVRHGASNIAVVPGSAADDGKT